MAARSGFRSWPLRVHNRWSMYHSTTAMKAIRGRIRSPATRPSKAVRKARATATFSWWTRTTVHSMSYTMRSPRPMAVGTAGSGAIFDLNSQALRPAGWTSADAAGLPILPGLVRYDEVAAGEIRHAIRFTAPQTRNTYVWPARHEASSLTATKYPPMGQRFRLKSTFDISSFSSDVQVILTALKKYGMILADNGSSWYLSGVPDERWNNDDLHEFSQIPGSAFEAVDVSSLMVDPNSGQMSGVVEPPPSTNSPSARNDDDASIHYVGKWTEEAECRSLRRRISRRQQQNRQRGVFHFRYGFHLAYRPGSIRWHGDRSCRRH